MAVKWMDKDEREAFRNGWAIFDYDGTGISVIMKIDDIHGYREGKSRLKEVRNHRHFMSDDAAFAFVKRQAALGCNTSRKALKMCPRQDDYLSGKI